jgi:hypothetical protein
MSTPETPDHRNVHQTPMSAVPIPFRGSLTVSDVYAAISLAQPLGNKIAIRVVRAFLVAALIYMCWLTGYAHNDGEHNLARMAFVGVMIALLPICVAIAREIWCRRRANQLCRERKLLYAPTEGELDANSIRSRTETAEGTLKWSAFCGYRKRDNVAVLYHHYPASYVIMARSKFGSDEDWAGFLHLASQELKQI